MSARSWVDRSATCAALTASFGVGVLASSAARLANSRRCADCEVTS